MVIPGGGTGRHMPFETTVWNVLESARANSEFAAQEIVRRYRTPILEFLRGKGLSEPDAEDVSQEALADICRAGFLSAADKSKGRFRSLLLSVVRHKLASHQRREFALKRGGDASIVSIDDHVPDGASLAEALTSRTEPPDAEFDRLWVLSILRQAVDRLKTESPRLAEVFTQFYENQLSYRDIGERAGLSTYTVNNHLHEARTRLKKIVRQSISEYVSSYEEFEEELSQLLKHL